jgi:hypothetical protein
VSDKFTPTHHNHKHKANIDEHVRDERRAEIRVDGREHVLWERLRKGSLKVSEGDNAVKRSLGDATDSHASNRIPTHHAWPCTQPHVLQ